MKKIIILIATLFATSSFATPTTSSSFFTQIIDAKQIGHFNSFDENGYTKKKIFSANLEIKKEDKTIIIPVLYTINDRKEESIIVEKEKSPKFSQEIYSMNITKKELLSQLLGKYKVVQLDF